jgi:cytochrome c biogenesis protein CcmG, thiol:disulfide interchange protein DsbE
VSARSRALVVARAVALVGVVILFAVLAFRIARGNPGAGLISAVRAHRAPAAPDVHLTVIWPHSETWPRRLQVAAHSGSLSLAGLRGYPVVLNFWASWCTPCGREASLLASEARSERGRVVFVAVDVNDFASDARRFLGAHRVPYVAVRGSSAVAARFGLVGLPETFYVDRRGRIRALTRGQVSAVTLRRQIAVAATPRA